MKIQKRIVDVKKHTIGYKVSGKNVSKSDAVRLAKAGKLTGVTVKSGRTGEYIASLPDRIRLTSLPITKQSDLRRSL